MGLSSSEQKQKSNNTTTSTFGREPGASSPDIDRLRNDKFEIDPGIAAQYGRQRADLNKSFAQPLGGYLSPQVRDAQMRSGNERLGRDEAQAMREGANDVNQLNFGRNAAVANLTAPPLVQRGSTSTGSGQVSQSPSFLDSTMKVVSSL